METEVLIVGAGLAGLSAGYHLGNRDHTIVEAESTPGGLCRSFEKDGFTFDCTGHLIHFRSEEGKKIITGLVGDRIAKHERKAAIFLENRYTDYPFQANTHGLPPEIIKECLLGFLNTVQNPRKTRIDNFYDWIQETFGAGISKYFMVPYNEKLWQHDLHDISLDWVGWSIPKPTFEEILNGALGIKNRQFGYNPVFFYPSEGGISLLPKSFPVRGKLLLGNRVRSVNMKKRRVTLADDTEIRYRYLLSTMPLNSLLRSLEDGSGILQQAVERLRHISVLNINIGIEREAVVPFHWIYFPERDKPFYRVGSPSNFSTTVAPPGTSALFVEVSVRPENTIDVNAITTEAIKGLRRSGILREDDKLATVLPVLLPCAYVIYDQARTKTVAAVQKALNRKGIFSFGRYGSWIYSSMEDAVLQGKEFANRVLHDNP